MDADKTDSDSLTESEMFSEIEEEEEEGFHTHEIESRKEIKKKTLMINRNHLPEYNFFGRKHKNLVASTKDPRITKEVLEWYSDESDEEREKELKLKCDLGFSKKAIEAYEKYKTTKALYQKVRPRHFPEEFPVSTETKLVQSSPYCDPKEITVPRPLTNSEIFDQLPAFFQKNSFFVDMDEKFKTNFFSFADDLYELKKRADIRVGDFAQTLTAAITGRTVEKKRGPGEAPTKLNLSSDSENDDIEEEPSEEIKIEPPKDENAGPVEVPMSENEGIPDTDADIEVHSVLSKKMKQEILKKATMYREEFSLKSVKTYFMIWKRKVDKLNEKKILKMKKKEQKREKKMVEKSLIQREAVKVVEKDKAPTKELYYQKDEVEIKLRHSQPRELSKFIKNCNNIYQISDGSEEVKFYKRKKKKDRKKEAKEAKLAKQREKNKGASIV